MSPVWEDPRVRRGLQRQSERWRVALDGGAQRIGWKVGMGGAVAEKMGTTGSLVGYLIDETMVQDGSVLDVTGWTHPVLEAEIAIRLGADLPAGLSRDDAMARIDALASAIEIADVELPFEDPEALLAGNLFHRGVVLGPFDSARAGADVSGVTLSVRGRERTYADRVDPLAAVGDLGEIACHVANTLGSIGEKLAAGDVVITGMAIPALDLEPGDQISVVHHGLGELSVWVAQ